MKLCAIVPAASQIEPETEATLRELERRGTRVYRAFGCSAIDRARSKLATVVLSEGFESILWIDSDICFDPDDAGKLLAHGLPLVGGIYPKKQHGKAAAEFLPSTGSVTFGVGGGLLEVKYLPFGFTLTHKSVFTRVRARFDLPICDEASDPCVPYFMPTVVDDRGLCYLSEDFSFCYRARACGIAVLADTSVRVGHKGGYVYGWEEMAEPRTFRPTVVAQ